MTALWQKDVRQYEDILDTSSLFKLYHQEEGTEELETIFTKIKITHIFLSKISKVEFTSTIWKKVRTKEITESEARETLTFFENDFQSTILLQLKV